MTILLHLEMVFVFIGTTICYADYIAIIADENYMLK